MPWLSPTIGYDPGIFPFPNEFGPRQMMMAHTEGKLEFAGVRPEEDACCAERRRSSRKRYPKCLSMVEALEQAHGLSSANIGTSSTTHLGEFTIPVIGRPGRRAEVGCPANAHPGLPQRDEARTRFADGTVSRRSGRDGRKRLPGDG